MEKVRLDKFLWAVRLFKKRPDATAACIKGSVLVNKTVAKQSRSVVVGDEISVKTPVTYRVYKVEQLLEKRVGAKVVEEYIKEITTEEDLFKLKMYYEFQTKQIQRDKPGRPTKKDRRDLDKYFEE
ncbi:MAG: RNA-binding S4 domain-containing protein [Bacteroidales bacterium]|nr:RNA-binding S4 domain-containing protein [Bacteroidales bacterium]